MGVGGFDRYEKLGAKLSNVTLTPSAPLTASTLAISSR